MHTTSVSSGRFEAAGFVGCRDPFTPPLERKDDSRIAFDLLDLPLTGVAVASLHTTPPDPQVEDFVPISKRGFSTGH